MCPIVYYYCLFFAPNIYVLPVVYAIFTLRSGFWLLLLTVLGGPDEEPDDDTFIVAQKSWRLEWRVRDGELKWRCKKH